MAFQRTNNMAILQQEGAIAGGYLTTLKTKLSDLELEERLLKATAFEKEGAGIDATNPVMAVDSTSGTSSASSASAPSESQTAFKELELVKMQRERLSKYLRPKHPKIARLDAEIDRGQKLLEIYRRQNRDQLVNSRQALQLKIASVVTSIKEWATNVVVANNRIAEAERLKLNVQRVQSVYDRLVMLVQNVGISRNIDQETLAILEPATVARRSFTQEIGAMVMSSAGGLGLGLGLILPIAGPDDRFTSLIEINEKLNANIVGQVPEVTSFPADGGLPLLEIGDPRHAYAESYRNLRSAILFMAAEAQRPKVLLITSALPNEGKSTVAANLAKTLALGGARVVLVDGDLRKGTLHQIMGMKREPGLTTLLLEPGDIGEVIQISSLPNLAFIASGSVTSSSGDLFLGLAFDQLLARLREQFDFVVIDSSPVFAADDATTLAPKADATLFVVRSRFSR